MSLMETLRARKLITLMVAIFAALLVQTSWVEEDAFITLRTAENFIHGYGLRWNVTERVQTYTNPLWMFLLAGTHALISNPFLALIALSMIISIAAMFLILTTLPHSDFGLLLAFSSLCLSKAFVDYSTSGLENPLSHLLATCFAAYYFQQERSSSERNLFLLSSIAGLSAFNRMDTILFYAPILVTLFIEQPTKQTVRQMLLGLSPFIVWEIFATIYYGFPIPNTYYAKMNTEVPLSQMLTQGVLYFINSLSWNPISLTIIFSAVGITFMRKRRAEVLLASGIIFYLVYVLYIGGDYMSGRFFSTPFVLSVILLVRGVEDATKTEKTIWLTLVLVLGLLLAPIKSYSSLLENNTATYDNTTGIADERDGYYIFTNLLLFSRAQPLPVHPFVKYGLQVRAEKNKVVPMPAVGMSGYFAGPETFVVDEYALGDPLLARLKPIADSDWRVGHFKRSVPDGYLASLESGENKITDPNLAAYYDKILLITRGNIWSVARWDAIWKMNTGQYGYLIEAYTRSHP